VKHQQHFIFSSIYHNKCTQCNLETNLFPYATVCLKKHPYKLILYIFVTTKFPVYLRHVALSLFYFPQNVIYVTILSLYVQTIRMFFIKHKLKFKYQPGHLKVKQTDPSVTYLIALLVNTFPLFFHVET